MARPAASVDTISTERRTQTLIEPPPEAVQGKKPLKLKFSKGMSLELPERFFCCLIVAFALYWHGAFTANDWMYLACSGFLMASLSSLILPYFQLSEIEVEGAMPPEVVMAESTDIFIQLRRDRKFGILSPILPIRSVKLAMSLLKNSVIHQTKERVTPPEVSCLDAISSTLTLKYSTPTLKRGIYEMESIELSSGFPFGLAWWRRSTEINRDNNGSMKLTVYPKSESLTGYFLIKLQGLTARAGLMASTFTLLNKSTIIRGIREYRMGDSPRHIHWPSSAKQGKLLVKEFDSEQLPAYSLFLDLTANWKTEEQFELAVLVVQSLTILGHQLGTIPQLMLNPPMTSKSLAGLIADLPQMPHGLELVAEILARVEPMAPSKSEEDVNALKKMISQSFTDRPLLAVSPASDSLVKSSERGDLYFYPVELQLVRGISDGEPEFTVKSASKGRSAVATKEAETSRWILQTNHLATISELRDLETL